MSKITNDSLAQDALYLYSEGNSGRQRLITWFDIRVGRRNVTTVEHNESTVMSETGTNPPECVDFCIHFVAIY